MCARRVFHATDALKKKEVVCLIVRAAGRISCLGFLWDRALREEAKGGRQFVSGCCWRLRKRWSRHKLAISRRQRSDGQSRAWSSSLLGVCHGAWRMQRATAVWILSSWRASLLGQSFKKKKKKFPILKLRREKSDCSIRVLYLVSDKRPKILLSPNVSACAFVRGHTFLVSSDEGESRNVRQ